jgi:hypothetical protein
LAVAKQEGLDEPTIAKIDRYEQSDLSDQHKAALRMADALMTRPGDLSDETVAELRGFFTDEQLVELTLDVMKWNYQKVSVVLGIDDEVVPGELTPLIFDDKGHWVRPT